MAHKVLVEFQERWIENTNETQTWYRIYSHQGPFEPYLIISMQVKRSIRKGEMIYVVKVKEIEQEISIFQAKEAEEGGLNEVKL